MKHFSIELKIIETIDNPDCEFNLPLFISKDQKVHLRIDGQVMKIKRVEDSCNSCNHIRSQTSVYTLLCQAIDVS